MCTQILSTLCDTHEQVAVFLGLGVGLVGAWLGYWGVRKMVLSEDGQRIDSGVELFVKWAIRIIGGAMLLQVCLSSKLRHFKHQQRCHQSSCYVGVCL